MSNIINYASNVNGLLKIVFDAIIKPHSQKDRRYANETNEAQKAQKAKA
ncbi:MAG: hypothetical protein IM566_04655 [Pseudanabaena sp. M152S2SP2A07QC]|nr:hypothetical protein [Pseudanabaena sp. M109S1SP2A07QC]MCA6546716.1 hypothetical protein [Pseudanabaena sp. M152S2SP2A07QC]